MLRVTIELVPHGIEEESEVIKSMVISNDGSGTYSVGNYTYQIDDNPDKSGRIFGHVHMNDAWQLVKRVLDQEYGGDLGL